MDIDSLVQKYLLQKGYNEVAKELETATSKRADNIILKDDGQEGCARFEHTTKPVNTTVQLSLALFKSRTSSATITTEYEKLRYWSFSSIESVRKDLTSLCFPIFVQR